jgi:pentatricopeptide repeat protein
MNVFERMESEGITGSVATYTSLLHGLFKLAPREGVQQQALDLWFSMRLKGVTPNELAYTAVMRCCLKSRQVERALNFLEEMKLEGLRPTLATYNVLLQGVAGQGGGGAAQWHRTQALLTDELLDMMQSDEVVPDGATFAALMKSCAAVGDVPSAKEYWKAMTSTFGLVPQRVHYEAMLECLGAAQCFTKERCMKRYLTAPRGWPVVPNLGPRDEDTPVDKVRALTWDAQRAANPSKKFRGFDKDGHVVEVDDVMELAHDLKTKGGGGWDDGEEGDYAKWEAENEEEDDDDEDDEDDDDWSDFEGEDDTDDEDNNNMEFKDSSEFEEYAAAEMKKMQKMGITMGIDMGSGVKFGSGGGDVNERSFLGKGSNGETEKNEGDEEEGVGDEFPSSFGNTGDTEEGHGEDADEDAKLQAAFEKLGSPSMSLSLARHGGPFGSALAPERSDLPPPLATAGYDEFDDDDENIEKRPAGLSWKRSMEKKRLEAAELIAKGEKKALSRERTALLGLGSGLLDDDGSDLDGFGMGIGVGGGSDLALSAGGESNHGVVVGTKKARKHRKRNERGNDAIGFNGALDIEEEWGELVRHVYEEMLEERDNSPDGLVLASDGGEEGGPRLFVDQQSFERLGEEYEQLPPPRPKKKDLNQQQFLGTGSSGGNDDDGVLLEAGGGGYHDSLLGEFGGLTADDLYSTEGASKNISSGGSAGSGGVVVAPSVGWMSKNTVTAAGNGGAAGGAGGGGGGDWSSILTPSYSSSPSSLMPLSSSPSSLMEGGVGGDELESLVPYISTKELLDFDWDAAEANAPRRGSRYRPLPRVKDQVGTNLIFCGRVVGDDDDIGDVLDLSHCIGGGVRVHGKRKKASGLYLDSRF